MLAIAHILAITLVLGILIYEDLRFRLIHLWIFPVLAVLMFTFQWSQLEWWHPVMNGSFLAVQFLLLTLWFSIKEKKFVLITQSYLGSGDIALWCVLAFFFSPLNFIVFFLCSLLGSLILTILFRINAAKKIPLAGFQGIFLCIVLMAMFVLDIRVRDDSFIFNLLV